MQPRFLAFVIIVASPPALADDADPAAPVRSVEHEPQGYFQVGVGYNPDDGFLASTSVVQPDLFGTGQMLRLDADLSTLRQHFVLAHAVPDLADTGLSLETQVFMNNRVMPGFTRTAPGGSVTLGKKVGAHTRLWTRYTLEHVSVSPGATALARSVPAATSPDENRSSLGEGLYASLSAGVEYTTLDTPFLPRRGTRFAGFVERADRRLGSAYDLEKAGVAIDHARLLGPFTLRLGGRATYIRNLDAGPVPLAHRLFHDGHAEVRGYGLDQADFLGDNAEASARAELELPVWKAAGLSIAGFADAGYRFNQDANASLLQRSVGASLIWRSPIGVLRFDWAVPLDGSNRDRPFLFSLGGGF